MAYNDDEFINNNDIYDLTLKDLDFMYIVIR